MVLIYVVRCCSNLQVLGPLEKSACIHSDPNGPSMKKPSTGLGSDFQQLSHVGFSVLSQNRTRNALKGDVSAMLKALEALCEVRKARTGS